MNSVDIERQEALEFHPGQSVESKHWPGVFDVVAEYDPMMVPPVILVNDPQPRYPEELRLMHRPLSRTRELNRRNRQPAQYPSCRLHNRLNIKEPVIR